MQGWLHGCATVDIRLKVKSTRECLQDRRLQFFGHVERVEESTWSSKRRKRRTFKVIGSFSRGILKKM